MRRLLAFTVYVVACLLFFEIVVRLVFVSPIMAGRRGYQDDLSWRRWWVHRRQSGHEIRYSFERYDATKGWITKPNLRDLPVFGSFHEGRLSTNSRGLRERDEYDSTRRPGIRRLVVLGDSFTFGEEVGDDEVYDTYLERLLPNTEVVNMGVRGYGHDQMLILFREEGVRLAPDLVLLGFVEADMQRNLRGFRDYAKPRFALVGGELRLLGSPVPRPEEILRLDWARPRLRDAWSIISDETWRALGRERLAMRELTTRLLAEIVTTARGAGARPILVYLPTQPEIDDPAPTTDGERYLLDACPETGAAACISTRPAFRSARARGTTFGEGRHWNAHGHRVVAEVIATELARRALPR